MSRRGELLPSDRYGTDAVIGGIRRALIARTLGAPYVRAATAIADRLVRKGLLVRITGNSSRPSRENPDPDEAA